jgi:hypothetical protein
METFLNEEFVYMCFYDYGGNEVGYTRSDRKSYLEYLEDPGLGYQTHFKVPIQLYKVWIDANNQKIYIESRIRKIDKTPRVYSTETPFDGEFVYMCFSSRDGYNFGYNNSDRESYLKYIKHPTNKYEVHFKLPLDLYEALCNACNNLKEVENQFNNLAKAQQLILGV